MNSSSRNAISLIGRVIITTAISLYTSKVLLAAIGVVDFGVIAAVTALVALFNIASVALAAATQRNIIIALKKNDEGRVIGASIFLHIAVAVITLIIVELLGIIYFLDNLKVGKITTDTLMLVFQSLVFTQFFLALSQPFVAITIGDERIKFYTIITLAEVIVRFIGAYGVLYFHAGLGEYCVVIMIAALLSRVVYYTYLKESFTIRREYIKYDKIIVKQTLGFTGWSMYGSTAFTLSLNGLGLIINVLVGPVASASYAIALQVKSAIENIYNSIALAVIPKITKLFSSGKKSESFENVIVGTKFILVLTSAISSCVIVFIDPILKAWLDNIPEMTKGFLIMACASVIIECLSALLIALNQATGNIKKYQLHIGGLMILVIPLSYVVIKELSDVFYFYVLVISHATLLFFSRVGIIKKGAGIDSKIFYIIFTKACFIVFIQIIAGLYLFSLINQGYLIVVILACALHILVSVLLAIMLLFNKEEQISIIEILKLRRA